jgi:heat shock protein 5
VAFNEGEILIGDSAKNQFSSNPTNTIFGAKRIIGRPFSDPTVTSNSNMFPFKILNKNDQPVIQVETGPGQKQEFNPEQISAMVLGKLKETAELYLGKPVTKAVVTGLVSFKKS